MRSEMPKRRVVVSFGIVGCGNSGGDARALY